MKRKSTNNFTQEISDKTYEWFVLQRSKRIPISGPILQEIIFGEAASVDSETVEDWTSRLPMILENYDLHDVYNCDETGLFFKLLSDRTFILKTYDCKG
ncbi:unnamed protein product, partial [Adineta ricciae]